MFDDMQSVQQRIGPLVVRCAEVLGAGEGGCGGFA